MSDQFSLPGFDEESTAPPRRAPAPRRSKRDYSLFVALVVEAEDRPRFDPLAEQLRNEHGLKPCISHERRHVSLLTLEEYAAPLDRTSVEAHRARVVAVISRIGLPSLPINFTSAMSLGKPEETREMAFALRCDDESTAGLLDLTQYLTPRLIGKETRSLTPHMTLLYDSKWVGEHPIDPLQWTPRKLVLVLSHLGKSHYDHLVEWELPA